MLKFMWDYPNYTILTCRTEKIRLDPVHLRGFDLLCEIGTTFQFQKLEKIGNIGITKTFG